MWNKTPWKYRTSEVLKKEASHFWKNKQVILKKESIHFEKRIKSFWNCFMKKQKLKKMKKMKIFFTSEKQIFFQKNKIEKLNEKLSNLKVRRSLLQIGNQKLILAPHTRRVQLQIERTLRSQLKKTQNFCDF